MAQTETPGIEMNNELWPEGDNKQLLYAMAKYIHQILKEHGTRLIGDRLVKLSKLKSDMNSLLETLNGIDFKIPDLNFTLPGIYKFYNNTIHDIHNNNNNNNDHTLNIPSSSYTSSTISSNISLDLSSSSPSNINAPFLSTNFDQQRSKRSPSAFITLRTDINDRNNNIDNDNNNDGNDDKMDEKYKMFDAFLVKLKEQNNSLNVLSPQYLVFLEEARKRYNLQFKQKNSKYIIKSLDNVPSLRSTLYQIRHIPQQQTPPNSDEHPLIPSVTSSSSSSLFAASYSINKERYNPLITQKICIMGYFNTYLSMHKNGKSEFKKSDIGFNEIFTSIPMIKTSEHETPNGDGDEIYIKTNYNLYLGSDENGLLFLGNVRKHHQIWFVESNDDKSMYSFRNYYGLYLCAEKTGKAMANRKNKKNWEKFKVFSIDNINNNKTMLTQSSDDEYVIISIGDRNREKRRRSQQKNRDKRKRKISIDDMDIPILSNNKLIMAAPKTYSKRGHIRRASARINIKPPPKPQRKSHHIPKRAITPPPPGGLADKFGINNDENNNKSTAPPPPPRLKRNSKNELELSLRSNIVSEYDGFGVRQSIGSRAEILKGIKSKCMRSISNEEIESKFALKIPTKIPTLGGHQRSRSMVMMGSDPLMDELKKKLMAKRKSIAIDDNDNDDNDDDKKEEEIENNDDNDNDDDDDEEEEENKKEDLFKPAPPRKSAKIVVQKIRSKYQRPLPALPQTIKYIDYQQENEEDEDEDEEYNDNDDNKHNVNEETILNVIEKDKKMENERAGNIEQEYVD